MTPISISVTLLSSLYLGISLLRLYQYIRIHGQFLDSSSTRLMVVGFSTGIVYLTGNQEIQEILQSYVSFLSFPIVPLIFMFFGVIMVSYLYLVTLRKFTLIRVETWITRFHIIVMLAMIVFTLAFHNKFSFFQFQVIIAFATSLSGIIASLYIAPIMRIILREEQKTVHQAQFRCFVLMIITLSSATIFLAIDSVYKLWFSINTIYTPTYILSMLFHSISLIAQHMVNEGNFTNLADYPAKIGAYIKLTRLYNAIQDRIQFPDAYDIPLPKQPAPAQIDMLNYHLVIQISDRYLWLDDANIKRSIEQVIQSDLAGNQIIFELAKIQI